MWRSKKERKRLLNKKPRTWRIWRGILKRAKYKHTYAPEYRDVKVADRWLSYENFVTDMGLCPSDKHSIDRIDPFGHYEPGNCRWATRLEQARNTRKRKLEGLSGTPLAELLKVWDE